MTDNKKETVWITIPDEGTPALDAALKKFPVRNSSDRVQNKAFWAIGFAALLVFVALLFAPREFASLMKGSLFDGGFQIVPEDAAEQSAALLGGGKDPAATETGSKTEGTSGESAATTTDEPDENVVGAEEEAVSIQIEPLADNGNGAQATGTQTDTKTDTGAEATGETEGATGGTVTSTTTGTTTGTTSTTATTGTSTEGTTTTVATGTTTSGTGTTGGTQAATTTTTGTGAEALDANAQMLQALSQQLDEFKNKEKQNEQLIQELMQLLADQKAGVHGTAATDSSLLPIGQTAQIGQTGGIQATDQFGTGAGTGVYRYNTHTITVSPYDILAKNKGIQSQQATYQANLTYNNIQAYSAQTYNPALAGVKGQPGTGPAETILLALALASFGVLAWGIVRAVRA